jgi:hypothetical protein
LSCQAAALRVCTNDVMKIAEGKVRTYEMSANWTESSGGEGGKDSTLDVAKAIADYASS